MKLNGNFALGDQLLPFVRDEVVAPCGHTLVCRRRRRERGLETRGDGGRPRMRFIGAVEEMIARIESLRTLPIDEKYIQRDHVVEELQQLHNLATGERASKKKKTCVRERSSLSLPPSPDLID